MGRPKRKVEEVKQKTQDIINGLTLEESKMLRELERKKKAYQRDIPRLEKLIEQYPNEAKRIIRTKIQEENVRTKAESKTPASERSDEPSNAPKA